MECFSKLYHIRLFLKISRSKLLFRPMSYLVFAEPLHPAARQLIPSPTFVAQQRNYAKKGQGKMSKGKQKMMHLSEDEMSDVIDIDDYRAQLLQVQEKLKRDFVEFLSLRTSNVDNLTVELDGEKYPLHELAQISKKNQNLIAINMSDFPEALKPAIKAITESGTAMNPQQEGTMIYLAVPKLTREHREKLAKNAKTLVVKAKEDIRNVQNYFVKEAKEKTDLSEDLIFSATNQIMAIAEQSAAELEQILKKKHNELLSDEK